MSTAQPALSPHRSVTVTASAGSGKTWLLVTRLVRLLLEGTAPDAILAITFTRKAAAEMASRLRQRLHELAAADDGERARLLEAMDIPPRPEALAAAAGLYERHLFDPRQIRVTTFHAFCQELLRRFPLEADVPAGFDVLEAPRQLQEAAWDALADEATADPDGEIGRDLEALFECLNGHLESKAALLRFLHHRSDWWAYTHREPDPVAFAEAHLIAALEIDPDVDPLPAFFSPTTRAELQEFAELLGRHATATNLAHADCIARALDPGNDDEPRLIALKTAFFTQRGERRTRKAGKTAQDAMGAAGTERLLVLHDELCRRIETLTESLRRRATLTLSRAWYRAGARLLDHYQRLKTEQRILDFSDLEWKAFLLLNHADHALWVQYKLDRRIEHLLVDEFQDTNPTQWHLLFPLLQEFAAGAADRRRSVFLVGDAKQSIYRFRRAEPALFPAARRWLQERLQAADHALSASWRSSPAIIRFVNRAFGEGPLYDLLPEFMAHSTHRTQLAGVVELLPLIGVEEEEQESPPPGLRNPLQRPRPETDDRRHHREGHLIAHRIRILLGEPMIAGEGADARPARFDDIMILVRSRTHVHAYEEALRANGIPYVTASRGTLLACLEIRDLVALLEILIVPYNNLALAQVLRSPLFACSNDDLMRLAAEPGAHWLDRVMAVGANCPPGSPLARAAAMLPRWQTLAGQRPVHDFLDRIYSEGNVMARYQAAFPSHLRPRVRANLSRFIALALEMDSGRYPSLTAFLNRLETLQALEEDAPDEASENTAGSVRLLTIHAAKGLEAPVVFLADAAAPPTPARGHRCIVRWPAEAARPSHFLLCARAGEADERCEALLNDEAREAQREQANLLYVAVTRAKQRLYISGCESKRGGGLGWYGALAARLGDLDALRREGWRDEFAAPAPRVTATAAPKPQTTPTPAGLSAPLAVRALDFEIAPSRGAEPGGDGGGDEQGRERGLAIHRFMQRLADGAVDEAALLQQVCAELGLNNDDQAPVDWLAEARRAIADPTLRDLFDPTRYERAFNEVPICYEHEGRVVSGVVDRLVIAGDRCTVIDYKTHRQARTDNLELLAAPYREQMRWYADGARRLWPDKHIAVCLLFTACAGRLDLML